MSTPATETAAPAAEDTAAPSTGDSTEATPTDQQPDAQESATDDGDVDLGESEEGTLEYWRQRSRKNERDAKKRDRDLRSMQEQVEAMRAKMEGREAEHQAAIEAQRVKDEALAAANLKIAKANLRAAAAGKLADPTDALTFIDPAEFEVDDDGNVDEAALSAAIDDLIKSKPYLAAQGKRFQGDADGGARKESRPEQITRDELSRMTSEQIVQAKKDGRLSDLLGA